MSMAYALSGGIELSSGPSGIASAAMTAVTRTTARTRIGVVRVGGVPGGIREPEPDLAAATLDGPRSAGSVTSHDHASSSSGKATSDQRAPLRPSRMPRPMPRKLAISRKLLKNPM